jgi:DNA-binding protein YbaB
MTGEREPVAEWRGTALNGAVHVSVDGHGRVRSVDLHPQIVRRVGLEQLERAVVAAHAQARAASATQGR